MGITKAVLIVGGSGFVGTHIALKLRSTYKVFATYHRHPLSIKGVSWIPFNVENRHWVKRVVMMAQPDIVIYAAGNSDIEAAEFNARLAERTHSGGPATIATTTEIIQPRFIYISNPYVFDGSRGNYHENDTVLPQTVLGRMKLGGENVIRSKCLNYIILRCSPLIGRGNGSSISFMDQLRMSLDRDQRFAASHQELHSFAPIEGLTDLLPRLISSGVRNRILHYGGLTKVSAFEFAKAFAKKFKYNPELIIPKTFSSRKGVLEGSMFDFSLNSTQLTETLKIKPFLLEESLDLIEKQLISAP